MSIAKVTSKGQITVPRDVRLELQLGPGSRVRFVRNTAGEIVVSREPRSVTRLRGILKYDGPVKSLGDMEAGIAQGATGDDAR